MTQSTNTQGDSTGKPLLRLIPLGGLGEIGKNMMLLEAGDSILVIEKRPIEAPMHSKTGSARLPPFEPPQRKTSAQGAARGLLARVFRR